MKWNCKVYGDGEYRIVKKFLLFPCRINNIYRWLETAYIVQRYSRSPYGNTWTNIKFAERYERKSKEA